jgi:hypothetical protein
MLRDADGIAYRSISKPAAVITVLVLVGQVLELRARERDRRRHQGACWDLAPKTAPSLFAIDASGNDVEVALDLDRGRRPAARAARREGARSTASSSRAAVAGRRIDAHRRARCR